MSIQADATREVVSVPIGHNARTSEEALRLFGLVSSLDSSARSRRDAPAGASRQADLEILRRAEKDRLPVRNLTNRKSYWRRYLVGEGNLIGFDIMAMSDDYRQLMQDQLLALEIRVRGPASRPRRRDRKFRSDIFSKAVGRCPPT